MKIVRLATEAEVIAHFLRSEFHQKEYHHDRREHESVVLGGDLNDQAQNTIRKKLLFRRHRITWNELPGDVRWSLAQLDPEDVQKLRISPRGQWPKMAAGADLTVAGLIGSIRDRKFSAGTSRDVSAIHALAYRMRRVADKSSILLIGIDSEHPITILEGNHRVLAAALNDPTRVCSLHSYIGLSPKMQECYLYGAESPVFFRQAWRRIRSLQPRLLTAAKASPLFSE